MRRLTRPAAALVLCLAGVPQAHAQAATVRSEVPIREVILSNGFSFYSILIGVGGTVIEAGLDTGSTGLRVLPRTLARGDAVASPVRAYASFEIGTEYRGSVGNATLTVGDLAGPSTLHLVGTIGCRRDVPECPAARVSPERFGFMGLGLPREGFRAMMGIGMSEADIQSPLSAIGAERWIVQLPLPGASQPGRLILNPGDDEVEGFALLPTVAGDSVTGCILNEATGAGACGAVLLDTGGSAIAVRDSSLAGGTWAKGTAGTITLYDDNRPAAVEHFTIGLPSQASGLLFQAANNEPTTMNLGRSPYFAFDVLYMPGKSRVGLRPRPPQADAPVGVLVATSP
jgi:hypothetical protein